MHISRVTRLEIQQRCDNLDDVSSSSIFIIHYLNLKMEDSSYCTWPACGYYGLLMELLRSYTGLSN
jgi:hypothetical protein